jgi:hypothetical protein
LTGRVGRGTGDVTPGADRGWGDFARREVGNIGDAGWLKGGIGVLVGVPIRETGRSRVARPTTLDTGVFLPLLIVAPGDLVGATLREPVVALELSFAFGRTAAGGDGESEETLRRDTGRVDA